MDMLFADHLSFKYEYTAEDAAPVLHDILLHVEKGSVTALLGPNGCGKSTFAKLCNAMLLPTGGKMLVLGTDTAQEDKQLDVRRTVGLVLQNPDNQLVTTIVEEDVAFGPENLGVPPEADKNSGWPSPASWPCSRIASCSTSRPPCSTRRAAPRCWTRCAA